MLDTLSWLEVDLEVVVAKEEMIGDVKCRSKSWDDTTVMGEKCCGHECLSPECSLGTEDQRSWWLKHRHLLLVVVLSKSVAVA